MNPVDSPSRPTLIFRLLDKLYGVNARLVREIVRLPEVTPVDEAPPFLVGVINLRGHVVPVMDLNVRLGRRPEPYPLSDAVVVLERQGTAIGLIVSEVVEVRFLDEGELDPAPPFAAFDDQPRQHQFITRMARVDEELVMLLEPEHENFHRAWFTAIHPPSQEEGDASEGEPLPLGERRTFNPHATPAQRAVFRARAERLRQHLSETRLEGLLSLAVIRLHGELLGVELEQVEGFTRLRRITPIPCAPPHVGGNVNLRGEILTLLDLARVLELPRSEQAPGMAMVAGWEGFHVGIPVHDILDILHLPPEAVTRAPEQGEGVDAARLKGAVRYGEVLVGILDLKKILTHPGLMVNETV